MYTINNKFEIGEECFSVYRKPVDYKCPICEGNGRFIHSLDWLERLELEKAMMGRGIDYETAEPRIDEILGE